MSGVGTCPDFPLIDDDRRGQTLDIELKDGSMTTTPDLTLWVMANSQTGDGRKLNTEIGLFTEVILPLGYQDSETDSISVSVNCTTKLRKKFLDKNTAI